jgi:microcystin-dependent protein
MADFKISEDYIVDKLGYAQSYPVGSVIIIMSSTIPDGWLLCDGRPVSRTSYSELWTALGTTSSPYGLGDGTSTFNLPPLVLNTINNPFGRYAVSRQSSEPAFPANFLHSHASYKANTTNYTVSTYSANHNHAGMNLTSSATSMTHNHANMGGGSGLNNVTSNSASSRQSSANNTVQYHNTPSHDHGSTFTATLTMNTSSSVSHTHPVQVHSADSISHSHTANQNTNVVVGASTFQGISLGEENIFPISKDVYFIIKY